MVDRALFILAIVSLMGCTDFSASGCKRDSATTSGIRPSRIVTSVNTNDYTGLECISWEIDGEDLSIDLINFPGVCGTKWKGDDDVDGHTVTLEVEEDDDGTTSPPCGICAYDFSFRVDRLPEKGDITVKIKVEGQDSEKYTIAAARREAGVVCKHPDFHPLDSCCGLYMYCSIDSEYQQCNEGLTCIASEPNKTSGACYQPCETDDACPQTPVPMRCVSGICDLKETF